MDILEALNRKMTTLAAGYTPTSPLFRALPPSEVESFITYANDMDIDGLPLKDLEALHPVVRYQLMLQIAQSLHAQNELT